MRQLNEIANNYASENAVDKLKETLAKVYADGYRDGFRDCKEELSVNLRSDKTKYVDLGLPSGTLWASDYETDNSEIYYTTYAKALELNIPSLEQYNDYASFAYLGGIMMIYYVLGQMENFFVCIKQDTKKLEKKIPL